MFNCYRVLKFNRLIAVVGTQAQADHLIQNECTFECLLVSDAEERGMFEVIPAFIEGIGF